MNSDKEIQKEYFQFIEEITRNEEIWILEGANGMACHPSENDDQKMCILFWSGGILAEAERVGDFEELEAQNIPLKEFISNWLPGMDEEGVLVGLNWQNELGGLETEPSHLINDLLDKLPDHLHKKYSEGN